jgi:hypothetical protein
MVHLLVLWGTLNTRGCLLLLFTVSFVGKDEIVKIFLIIYVLGCVLFLGWLRANLIFIRHLWRLLLMALFDLKSP